MNLLENPPLLAAVAFVGGSLVGYWLLRWKERNIRAARRIEQQAILDAARREADALTREAQAKAAEDALRLRQETETTFDKRRTDLYETERRLVERDRSRPDGADH